MATKTRTASPPETKTTLPVRRRGVRGWRLTLAILGGILGLLILGGLGYGAYTIRRPLATTSGTVRMAGLSAPVTVVRDKDGFPHLTAANQADLMRAQGYVEAQDRLWEMDFYRRVGAGQLSEVLGGTTLDIDRFARTIGWRRAAQTQLATLPAATRATLQEFADGVNAFLDTHADNLPIEFSILSYKPEHWTPLDTATFAKVMAWDLGENLDTEITMADLQAKLGATRAAQLLPPYPGGKATIVPQSALPGNPQGHAAAVVQRSGIFGAIWGTSLIGSNNWVIDGTHTVDGHPLLANDPHLGVQNPSIWYALQLRAQDGSMDVEGVTFPGVPGIVVGHNAHIAWGVTNLGPDTEDLFVEKLDPAGHPGQYQTPGGWQPLDVITETIPVKGDSPVTLTITNTRHGPLLDGVREDLKQPAALEWAALQSGTILSAVQQLDQATDWNSFHAALADWDAPGQNFVYADTAGNIGYQATGRWPIRKQGNGLVPVDGASGAYDWTGFVPYEQLPRVYNPPQHYLVTANNRVVGPDFPYLVTGWWGPWFRAERIGQLIAAKPKLSADDVKAIQYDTHDLLATRIAPHLATVTGADAPTAQAAGLLKGWDGDMRADSAAAAIYEVAYNQILTDTFAGALGGTLADEYLGNDGQAAGMLLYSLVEDPTNAWWDDPRTPAHETRDDILRKSLQEAVTTLTGRLGSDPTKWTWGDLHTVTFGHTLGAVSPLDKLLNFGPFPSAGDAYTVNRGGYAASAQAPATYFQTDHSSMRMISDPGDWTRTQFVFAPGESGQVASDHWGDLVQPWLTGAYYTLPWSAAQIAADGTGTLTLAP